MIYAENIFLCIVIPLVVSVLLTRGEVRRYLTGFLLGMSMCLLSAYIGGFLNLVSHMSFEDTQVFISPIVEELMKFLPLLGCYIIFLPKEHHLTMFAVAIGAGFATFENCCYILTSGAERISYVLIRGMAVGVMHIVSIFALSVWLILAVRLKAICFPVLVAGAAISITFHALYNLLVSHTGISANIGYLMPILTAVLLYVLYRRLSETAMLKKPDVQDVQ